MRGWTDLPTLIAEHKAVANNYARSFAEAHHVATRTIRKPHGWVPPEVAASVEIPSTTINPPKVPEIEPSPTEEEQLEQLARRHQKFLRRHETQQARRPTAYDKILSDWLDLPKNPS